VPTRRILRLIIETEPRCYFLPTSIPPSNSKFEALVVMSDKPENATPSAVKYHYIKGNFFRVVHADGAIGGLTPNRSIFLSLFSERAAIPQIVEQALNPDGTLGAEKKWIGKDGLVREVEVGVMLSGPSAKRIAEWLIKQVQILDASEPEPRLAADESVNPVEQLP
jgi:hypothetical protein